MPFLILSVGKDDALLHSRNAILRSAGYIVTAETSLHRALSNFNGGDYDAVLLCHSLDRKGAETFAIEVHKRSPSTPVVHVAGIGPQDGPTNLMPIECDPPKMLASLRELIGQAVSYPQRVLKLRSKE